MGCIFGGIAFLMDSNDDKRALFLLEVKNSVLKI